VPRDEFFAIATHTHSPNFPRPRSHAKKEETQAVRLTPRLTLGWGFQTACWQFSLRNMLFHLFTLSFTPTSVPTITIAPGVKMPLAGVGTWQYNATVAERVVAEALGLGYRHVDTALNYHNQDGVGRAIAAAIDGSRLTRRDLFLVSKIPGGLNHSAASAALETSLAQLFPKATGAYVDLMLVHFPATWAGAGGKAARQEEWSALEAFVKEGKARAIGVSHYCRRHLDDILEIATIRPAVNQVQYHVGMGAAGPLADDDMAYMRSKGVTFEGFSPLCGPCGGANATELISGALVSRIGRKHGKSGAQVALRWQVQQGIPVIPKSKDLAHLRENIDLFSWALDADDMAALSAATKPAVSGATSPGGEPVSGDCSVA